MITSSNIMDLNFINASQNLSDSFENELYEISNNQETAITNSRIEIENGYFHKNEDVISEMREWLKKK
ncbi:MULTISPECIES: hypothetical protein [unclassified Flavobacterium]|uniref:hypothetical protein n=1 Tax=unclassified Flavobacterium TaxID=196869 RepID=UPI001F2D7FD5|nr:MULTISPECIES: hypothetical protein [unclassified Flavobacterium]